MNEKLIKDTLYFFPNLKISLKTIEKTVNFFLKVLELIFEKLIKIVEIKQFNFDLLILSTKN